MRIRILWETGQIEGQLAQGATGLAQCAEMVWQLRGLAEKRQVEGAKIAMSHNIGLGGACVVTMYRKATEK